MSPGVMGDRVLGLFGGQKGRRRWFVRGVIGVVGGDEVCLILRDKSRVFSRRIGGWLVVVGLSC